MKVKALISSFVVLAMAQTASASFWGKVKNVFNDCKYQEVDRPLIEMEKMSTPKLPDNITGGFDLNMVHEKPWIRDFRYVIVVNRAAKGPTAQTIRVYENGYLIINSKVSTGREGFELKRKSPACTGAPPASYWSNTPTGYYTPKFLSRDHKSSSWDSDMPFAVFYDVENGLALHQVYPKYAKYLGGRASGGCTRLPEGVAEDIFSRIELTENANVPLVNRDGTPVLDADGKIVYSQSQLWVNPKNQKTKTFKNYSALIVVVDDPR